MAYCPEKAPIVSKRQSLSQAFYNLLFVFSGCHPARPDNRPVTKCGHASGDKVGDRVNADNILLPAVDNLTEIAGDNLHKIVVEVILDPSGQHFQFLKPFLFKTQTCFFQGLRGSDQFALVVLLRFGYVK
jgi:hypothetical protein